MNYNTLDEGKNLFKNCLCNSFHVVIYLIGSSHNHKHVSPLIEKGNNLNLSASWFTPRYVYKVEILVKLARFMFVSSLENPTNTPFMYKSWIIALDILKLNPGCKTEGIMAPVSIGSIYPVPFHNPRMVVRFGIQSKVVLATSNFILVYTEYCSMACGLYMLN